METASRTSRSIRNMTVALIYFGVTVVLQFFSRRIFLERLGTEVLGLNTTAVNLLQFLNLAELGIGVAVAYALYKPLQERDRNTIAEIVALQGHLYRRIACVIIAGATLLSCFFPFIFSKMQLPLWYAYASFGVMLYSSLISYFFNYKQIVLSADQRDYAIKYSFGSVQIIKIGCQIAAVSISDSPYIWWLAIEVAGATAGAAALNIAIRRRYPYLRKPMMTRKSLMKKYPGIVADTKRLFIHRIAEYVLQQTSPLIIYACISMSMVAMYGNYMLISANLLLLQMSALGGVQASVGNLVAEGDRTHTISVFNELFSLYFFCAAWSTAMFIALTTPFITLWLGNRYILPEIVLSLMAAIYFIGSFRPVIDTFKAVNGLFSDVWAAVTEAALNLGLSILLGILYGLPGILGGVLISLLVIVIGWKPIYVMRCGMHLKTRFFWSLAMRHCAAVLPAAALLWAVMTWLPLNPSESWAALISCAIIYTAVFAITLAGVMYIATPGTSLLFNRLKAYIRR